MPRGAATLRERGGIVSGRPPTVPCSTAPSRWPGPPLTSPPWPPGGTGYNDAQADCPARLRAAEEASFETPVMGR